MATPTRLRLNEVLGELFNLFPTMRTGQLHCNLSSLVEATPQATWEVSDEDLLVEAEALLSGQRGKGSDRVVTRKVSPQSLFGRLDLLGFEVNRGMPLGRIVANLVAYDSPPESIVDWAAKIWDIEDDDLLALPSRTCSRPEPGLEDWSVRFRQDYATIALP